MYLRNGFSDSNQISNNSGVCCIANNNINNNNGDANSSASDDIDIVPLRRLSENLMSILEATTGFDFFADAKIVTGDGLEVTVHRCILSARSSFFKGVFGGDAKGGVGSVTHTLQLKEVAKDYDVGLDALGAVLGYLYSGRMMDPLLHKGKGGCGVCVDDDCSHVGCWPVVDFMVQVLYVSFTFGISELVSLYPISPFFFFDSNPISPLLLFNLVKYNTF